jgi:hypothetical protein
LLLEKRLACVVERLLFALQLRFEDLAARPSSRRFWTCGSMAASGVTIATGRISARALLLGFLRGALAFAGCIDPPGVAGIVVSGSSSSTIAPSSACSNR